MAFTPERTPKRVRSFFHSLSMAQYNQVNLRPEFAAVVEKSAIKPYNIGASVF
jgi:hypothetical protein